MYRQLGRQALEMARVYHRLKQRLDPARVRQDQNFQLRRERFYAAFWRHAASEIGASIEELGHGYLRIAKVDRDTIVCIDKIAVDDHLRVRAAHNKPFIQQWLGRQGLPSARAVEYDLENLDRALAFGRRAGGAIVVKPADGEGAGRGVTTGLTTTAGIVRASIWAAAFQPKLLAEEQIAGASYRLLYLDGELCDVVRRDPPVVVGDGRRSVRELIAAENAARLADDEPTALSPLVVDFDCAETLRSQGLSAAAVPRHGRRVMVKNVVNQNAARENHVVRAALHPATVALGQRLVRALGLRLAGLDLLTTDPSQPLERVGGVIGEINSTPGFHHHVLVADRAARTPVGPRVLELALS